MATETNIWTALRDAHAEFDTLTKDKSVKVTTKSGSSYGYTYADLSSLLEAVMPALIKHGVTLYQSPAISESGIMLISKLVHGESDTEVSDMIPLPNAGGDMKVFGSAITYLRRYMLMSQLGLAAEDDDGEIASTPQPRKSNPPSRNGKRAVEPPPVEPEPEPEQPSQSASVKLSKEDTQRIQDWLKDTGTARKAAEDWAVEIGACKNTFEAHNSMTKIVNEYGGKANAKNVGSIMEQYVYHQIEKLAAPVEEEVA